MVNNEEELPWWISPPDTPRISPINEEYKRPFPLAPVGSEALELASVITVPELLFFEDALEQEQSHLILVQGADSAKLNEAVYPGSAFTGRSGPPSADDSSFDFNHLTVAEEHIGFKGQFDPLAVDTPQESSSPLPTRSSSASPPNSALDSIIQVWAASDGTDSFEEWHQFPAA
ncbi:hypothetical protein Slin15195_G062360 [Septoria linicola]|uniref:Uncharacterized protein n=1 Tax=Septoria linicola TaxID=215465 RepID=A0A9Q9AVW5_9PEZI|nr:hypothetical protein Slin14017_G078170 [Septoria linicola]USW52917.1 hypothetical protein Slin15195_G062360 [Septoria linicola]